MSEHAQAVDVSHRHNGRPGGAVPTWVDATAGVRQARGRRVARDLVELSRLQNGGERAELTPLDLAALVRAICADYPPVRIEGPARMPLSTDSRRLARVLFALLDNAFLHGSPPVSVSFDATEIRIEDSGDGFASRVLARPAEPFVTGDRTRGRGVGLGLAIAARHASLLGAELQLSNGPAGGALARVRFAAGAAT
jgi:two-component system, OmpR family, sensor histidine kinase MtrB